MADLFQDYPLGPAWDEMFSEDRLPSATYRAIYHALQLMDSEELQARVEGLARSFLGRGVTFALGGEERPFPLDIVPRIISAAEWAVVSRGVAQRVTALEAFLNNVYGLGQVVADGVVPRRLIATSSHFHRHAVGIHR